MENGYALKNKRRRVMALNSSESPLPHRENDTKSTTTEFLTKEQLKEHLASLKQSDNDERVVDDSELDEFDKCGLCGVGRFLLAAKAKRCSSCGSIIKRNERYYGTLGGEEESSLDQEYSCSSCFGRSRRNTSLSLEKVASKKTLTAMKNCDETEESWVQCDLCEEWHHQICGLFNAKGGSSENTVYRCPKCWLNQMEGCDYKPSLDDTFFSAKNLPRTALSNHIERRLSRCLKKDREERAAADNDMCLDKVPEVKGLSVRVALSTKKKLEVNASLLDVIKDKNYPTEFEYTSKLILLFQKIEGVDVCIFTMYVQEYGSECSEPNQRSVYISYLDSIKYFVPNIEASSGEALRTVVYHEVLISYLDYAKRRGFTKCYLWSCPPQKGDEYIFYCRPESQKTPKPEKLRHWYHAMIQKAANGGIVVNRTTFYDRFFAQNGDRGTMAQLPYFDGDYWPGAIESLLRDVEKEIEEETKKGTKRTITKTTAKVMGLKSPYDVPTKDALLMKKLREVFLQFKEDFMVIDLQYVCTNCNKSIISGSRWYRSDSKSLHLCERCHAKELHKSCKGKHLLLEVKVNVPSATTDKDGILENNIFHTRKDFLDFFQDNSYQFDTIRRAKHSSMIILYHLHQIAAPTSEKTCCVCHKDVADLRWSCERCPGFHLCMACHKEKGIRCHVHQESRLVAIARVALSEQEQLAALNILRHISVCQSKGTSCAYRGCDQIRGMVSHVRSCEVQADGGCIVCHRTWYALRLHADQCSDQKCQIPFCKDLNMQASAC